MGKPDGKGTNSFNGIELEIVSYAYAKVGADTALPGVIRNIKWRKNHE